MTLLWIRGGRLYDPANGLDGEIRDLWVRDGRICVPPEHPDRVEIIDASGLLVAPGAIEIHSHIAGPQLAWARLSRLKELGGAQAFLPPARRLAEAYLRLGFTTLFDAAMPPLLSRHTRNDLAQMVAVDRGAFTLVGDHHLVLSAVQGGDRGELLDTLAWLLEASGGYALKLVNPGAGLAWKAHRRLEGLGAEIIPGGPTQRQWIQLLAQTAAELGLPHPIHLHAGNLGRPGSWRSLVETARALEGLPAHLCHIQFYSYADDPHGRLRSAAAEVVDGIQGLPGLTFDVGTVTFGPAQVITADLQAVDHLRRALKAPTVRVALEGEGGFGLLPVEYSRDDPDSAVQWATGLELMLRFPDPGRLHLTCDFPNGGSFSAYPWLLSLLMDREKRRLALEMVHPAARTRTGLPGLEREFSLGEVIALTSTGPAKALGLLDRGHLGPGAVADLRCYQPEGDWQKMFAEPEWVMKSGKMAFKRGEILDCREGSMLAVRPGWDPAIERRLRRRFEESTSLELECYGLGSPGIALRVDGEPGPGHFSPSQESQLTEVVPCRSRA